jgi:iron complex transport system ATP-binding protein
MNRPSYLGADGVRVRLGGRVIIDDVSFSLPRQCLAALVGPNGAGKTTLLRALAGLIPAEGSMRLGDEPLASLGIRERARRFAYLPQGHVIHWQLPVRDIVALGRYPHGATDPSRLAPHDAQAIERAMLATETTALAERPVTEISGGERSRVVLARVLAVEAPVILADEPTASLDPHYQIEVMRLLRRAADAGTLVIAVTHDIGLAARFADTVLVLAQGRLVAAGPSEDALAPAVLADVFRVDAFRGERDGKPVIVPWATS